MSTIKEVINLFYSSNIMIYFFINIILHTVFELHRISTSITRTRIKSLLIKIENGDIVLLQQGFGCLDSI